MTDCDYCDESFEDEDEYLAHLAADHDEEELSRIDQRRIESSDVSTGGWFDGLDIGKVALVVLAGLLFGGVIGYAVFSSSGITPASVDEGEVKTTPTGVGSVHYHAQMTVTVDGEQIDFSQEKYQLQDRAVHFESGNGQRVHVHAQRVTLEYFFATLGFDLTANSFESQNTTVTAYGPGTVQVTVNGAEVNPRDYVIQEGDQIRVVVNTDNSS